MQKEHFTVNIIVQKFCESLANLATRSEKMSLQLPQKLSQEG
jgi:hypothetical protein